MDQTKIQFIIELLQLGDTRVAVQNLKDVQDQSDKTAESLNKLGGQAKSALDVVSSATGTREAIDKMKTAEEPSKKVQNNSPANTDTTRKEHEQQVESGHQVELALKAVQDGPWAQQTVKINAEYDKRKKDLTVYYDDQLQKAKDNATQELQINYQKDVDLEKLDKQRELATNQTYQDLLKIGNYAENQLASGMTKAFMSIIQGTKTAGEAFKQFAAQFMEQVAQMIMQMVILRAVQGIVGELFPGANAMPMFGATPAAPAAKATADGGISIHPAANGILLAASGITGVSQVNSAAYFPDFNVLAGEAGSEMMTVLSRPSIATMNGEPFAIGNVGAQRMAVASLDSLTRMVRANGGRGFADGGMSGVPTLGAGGNSSWGGNAHLHVSMDPGLRAEIIQQSIAGARVQVATDLNTDTPIRRAAKGIVS